MVEPHHIICAWCEGEMHWCGCKATQAHNENGVFCSDTCATNWIDDNEEEDEMAEDYTEEQRLAYIKAARESEFGSEDIQIDEDATLSVTDDGAWVQAWVFVYAQELDDEKPTHSVLCCVCQTNCVYDCEDEQCPETTDHVRNDVCEPCQGAMACPL